MDRCHLCSISRPMSSGIAVKSQQCMQKYFCIHCCDSTVIHEDVGREIEHKMASVHCDKCLDPAYPEQRRFLAWFVDEHINTIMPPSPPLPRQRTGVGTGRSRLAACSLNVP
eukprot:5507795-Pyramimonas_sp.AAC.1